MANLSPRSKPRISYPPRNPILTPMGRSKDEPFLYFAVVALSPIYLPSLTLPFLSPLCPFPHQLQPPPGGSSRFVLSFLVSLGAIDGPDCSVLPPSLIPSGLTQSLFFPPAGFHSHSFRKDGAGAVRWTLHPSLLVAFLFSCSFFGAELWLLETVEETTLSYRGAFDNIGGAHNINTFTEYITAFRAQTRRCKSGQYRSYY